MLKINLSIVLILTYLITVSETSAHVQLDFPQGGESFVTGETIKIEWHNVQKHDQIDFDLYFSSDGGANWEAIELSIDESQFSYFWTVPLIATETGRVKVIQDNTGRDYIGESGDFIILTASALVDERTLHPETIILHENYPNPFNPVTKINYQLPVRNYVELSIYNSLGQKVATLVTEQQNAGNYQVEWDASGFASGVYLYQLRAGEFVAVKKMILLR
jgi:hypothetical protein